MYSFINTTNPEECLCKGQSSNDIFFLLNMYCLQTFINQSKVKDIPKIIVSLSYSCSNIGYVARENVLCYPKPLDTLVSCCFTLCIGLLNFTVFYCIFFLLTVPIQRNRCCPVDSVSHQHLRGITQWMNEWIFLS